MSSSITFDRSEVPPVEIGYPTSRPKRARSSSAGHALRWAYVPMIISVAVNAIFFVVYWVPEFGSFPGHAAVLTQLSPLASAELTSQSAPVVPIQAGRGSLIATFLLLAALVIPVLARSRRWQVRLIVPIVLCYLAAIGWVVTVLSLLARSALPATWLGVALMAAWVAAASVTVWRSFWVQPEDLPTRPTRVLWLVGLFALLNPLPVAMGRRLFAPELREAATDLAAGEDSLRMAALITPEALAVYLSGVAVALAAWAWYMVIPPAQPLRVPWVRRRPPSADPLGVRLLILAGCAVTLALSGYAAAQVGAQRAAQIESGSPAADLTLACETWVLDPSAPQVQTLALSGPNCAQASAYTGYHRVAGRQLDVQLSPVWARTPSGTRIEGRIIAAQYGRVVVAASSSRFDLQPDQLQGLRVTDGRPVWTFRCDDDQAMTLRFAGADGGDDAARGRITEFLEQAGIIAGCSNGEFAIDPANGRPLDS